MNLNVMSASLSPDTQPPRKRQRARKACLPCRQRKRKCDVQYPCSMCTTYGYQCQYPRKFTRTPSKRRKTPILANSLNCNKPPMFRFYWLLEIPKYCLSINKLKTDFTSSLEVCPSFRLPNVGKSPRSLGHSAKIGHILVYHRAP